MSGYDTCASRRVVVGVSGSLGSVTALYRAAAEARHREAELWPVLAWEPPGGESAARRSPAPPALTGEWQRLARERLLVVLGEVFGEATPAGVPLHGLVVRAAPGAALVETADRDDDILVVGAGRRGWQRAFSGRVTRYCLTHAHCPVLAIPPSPLEETLAAARRRSAWHLPLSTRQLSS